MLLHMVQDFIGNMEGLAEAFQKPPRSRPQIRDAVPLKDFIEKSKIENGKTTCRSHQFFQSPCQSRPAESFDQRALGTGGKKQFALSLDFSRAQVAP